MNGWRERLRALRDRILGAKQSDISGTDAVDEVPEAGVPVIIDDAPTSTAAGQPDATQPDARRAPRKTRSRSPVERDAATVTKTPATTSASKSTKARKANSSPAADGPIAQTRAQHPVAINLGIDFGTSFTKVCYRDVGTEQSGVVAAGSSGPLVPSVIAISGRGRLYLGDAAKSLRTPIYVPYLKMRLAGVPIGHSLSAVDGVDLNAPESVKALASWFLASVIARSQTWIASNQGDRLKGRTVVWSANVGVPVEHYDSPVLKIFEEVLGVAWRWTREGLLPDTFRDALAGYAAAACRLDSEATDFHAVPEIAAAVQSFVMSREALEGIYVYFDIGGGTVDGVAFNYLNRRGDRRINFYAGKVAPLGVAAIASAIGAGQEAANSGSFEHAMASCDPAKAGDVTLKVRRLVGEVVMTAKFKDGRDWQVDAIQSSDYERRFVGQLSPSRMKPLVVFLGGGGSRSAWYTEAISSTYKAFQHDRAGIPPYRLLQVPVPKDFSMTAAGRNDFNRYVISYGLSVPFGEGAEIGLPSQFAIAEKPKPRQPRGIVDYADSKDAYG